MKKKINQKKECVYMLLCCIIEIITLILMELHKRYNYITKFF